MKNVLFSAACATALIQGAGAAWAVSADIIFVVDQSGSMGDEFTFLGSAIGGFITDLQAAPEIDSVFAGLISYHSGPTLRQDLTDDAALLEAAFNNTPITGGTENALRAVDAALPGENADLGVSYRPGTVRSVVLITDEDADDRNSYSNSFGSGASALGAYLDNAGFLNNIIYNFGAGDAEFGQIDRPNGALFDIRAFRADRTTFFQSFTRTKLNEIIEADPDPDPGTDPGTPPMSPVPVPATLPLMALGLAGLGLAGRGRKSAT